VPRSKTPTVSLEEAKARFEAWRQNRKGEGRDTGRVVGGSGPGSPEGRRQPNLDGTACGVESSEAADGRDVKRIDETGPGGIRGTGRAEATKQLPECTIELECRRGKLRIRLKNASASYLTTLSRELLESAS
jgi:hypothetical protein